MSRRFMNQPKVHVNKVALEIIRAEHAGRFVEGYAAMLRDEGYAALERVVQKDRLDLTDAKFRTKYLDYITNGYGWKKH